MLNEVKPYFEISHLNSVPFAKVTEWDSYDNHRTLSNTLSYQENELNNKQFFHLFQLLDAIRIQFKSTYTTHQIKVFGCDESERNITAVKRTSNLNITDLRNAGIVEYNTFTAVYFGDGLVLDPDTEEIIEPDESGEYVPEWLTVGKNIILNSTQEYETTITDIVWLESRGKYAIVTDVPYSTFDPITSLHVRSQYNKEDYEIYEFDIDWKHFNQGKYQIEIKATHADFEAVTYLSERIDLKPYHENTHLIICENDTNNQINYSWGIQHLIRVPYEKGLTYSPSGENVVHKTDNNTYLIGQDTYENYEANFSPIPTNLARRLVMLFSLTSIYIDSKTYVSENKPEVERLEDSNLYTVVAKFVLSDNSDFEVKTNDYRTELNYDIELLEVGVGYLLTGGSSRLLTVN